jgi:hypothetical protein
MSPGFTSNAWHICLWPHDLPQDLIFHWHPMLMIAATVMALTEAVLAYRSLAATADANKRMYAKVVPMAWQTLVPGSK